MEVILTHLRWLWEPILWTHLSFRTPEPQTRTHVSGVWGVGIQISNFDESLHSNERLSYFAFKGSDLIIFPFFKTINFCSVLKKTKWLCLWSWTWAELRQLMACTIYFLRFLLGSQDLSSPPTPVGSSASLRFPPYLSQVQAWVVYHSSDGWAVWIPGYGLFLPFSLTDARFPPVKIHDPFLIFSFPWVFDSSFTVLHYFHPLDTVGRSLHSLWCSVSCYNWSGYLSCKSFFFLNNSVARVLEMASTIWQVF